MQRKSLIILGNCQAGLGVQREKKKNDLSKLQSFPTRMNRKSVVHKNQEAGRSIGMEVGQRIMELESVALRKQPGRQICLPWKCQFGVGLGGMSTWECQLKPWECTEFLENREGREGKAQNHGTCHF